MIAKAERSTAALLSSASENYGTPLEYCELARYVLGSIDLDPASSSYWNHFGVKARTFYDERLDGLRQPWFGNVFHNPPSNIEKNMRIRQWWDRLFDHYARGEVDAAIWLGFQLGQLQSLQGAAGHPLQFVNLFPRERMAFLVRMPGNAAPQPLGSPTHANYVTLLPSRSSPDRARAQIGRFLERGAALDVGGAVVRPA